VGVVLALAVVMLRVTPLTGDLAIFSLIEHFAYDVAHDYATTTTPRDIVIVQIDDKSLARLGRFQSWSRSIYADLLDELTAARVVGFDVLFPEPESVAEATDEAIRSAREHAGASAGDRALRAAMLRHGRVVLAAHWGPRGAGELPRRDVLQKFAYPRRAGRLARGGLGETLVLPTDELAQAAAGVGYVDIQADLDGVYRRFRPLMVGPESLLFPHFALAVAAAATGATPQAVVDRVPYDEVVIGAPGRRPIPIEAGGTTLIHYNGPTGTVPRISLVDVLTDPAVSELCRNKIVIVGATAPGLYDIRAAPYRGNRRLFLGVETNANIVDALLNREATRDARSDYWWAAFAFGIGALVSVGVWLTESKLAMALSLLSLSLVAVQSFFWAFALLHVWIPYGAVVLAWALPLTVGLSDRLTAERRLIQRHFGAYVSPDVLRELMHAPEVMRNSGRRTVTLMFTDVRSSTALSENTTPEVWVAQLNEYLTQMSEVVLAHDGYLDKFMGDGIMAIWNAFGAQPEDQAGLAVDAGAEMFARLEVLNRQWEMRPDRTALRIGIGIHTGEAVVGNVGSDERVQFTAIGDSVNTAARIGEACKVLGAEFIVSQETATRAGDEFVFRPLGETQLRGRSSAVGVFEVLLPSGEGPENGESNVVEETQGGQATD